MTAEKKEEIHLKHQMTEKKEERKMEKKESHGGYKKGGIRTMPFIFSSEVCERLAMSGFGINMLSYLTQQLYLPLTKAANTLTNFTGTASLTPLLGAFIADSFAGRFWTITVASIIYQIGMISLTISAVLPKLRPPPCHGNEVCQEANSRQLAILCVSLLLTAIGSGGIRPCVVAFGADQFDETDPKQKTRTWNFFNWYYFCMSLSSLVAVTVIVYIQETIGWGWGLGIPSIAMFLSIIIFIVAYPLYQHLDPSGSPFTRLIQVMVAAFKKRKLTMVSDPKLLYENDELDLSISITGKLLHSEQLRFLDKAAILTEEEKVGTLQTPNLWRLCTVHRVEELKSMIRMGPIWASGILLITASAQQNTFSLQQARTMDRHLSHSFQIPPGSMSVFSTISMLTSLFLYDRIIIPIARRFTGLDRGISFLHRMGIGLAISIFATLIAGFIEIKRKHVASVHGLTEEPHSTIPISFCWLIPQYALHGMGEAFMSIGHLEFLYDQAPESMRSMATALHWTAISLGNYTSTMLVTLVHAITKGSWLQDNLNKGKLEYFYWLITLLQVLNLIYYMFCAKFYSWKSIQLHQKGVDSEAKVELAGHV
ncbi:protein NRT1/ PTR FAMILY 3.1-like [Telopea speciosissima]|uniref:protein NRT1/ PTR FAMILY 3.1-like n=1 Tax=Telopea speciosissima TaxID=54955 RepID=UPI001CC5F6EE|nr:protein NRT1/ PTR FAMILY 3.1-like [Telopea speciosissima]